MIQTSSSESCRYAQTPIDSDYDVIVIGAGPAGATNATLLAEAGIKVLLLERESIPRFHVGESLLPMCYFPLERLGLLDRMKQSSFPKKYSVQFVTDRGKVTAPFYFDEYRPHESSQTWQVERGLFDQMMVEHAAEHGATIKSKAQVLELIQDGNRVTGLKVKVLDPETNEPVIKSISSKIVVDATGQSSFIVNRLGLKQPDQRLKKGTIWTYWKGALRDPGRDEGATLIMQTEGKKSWFWYIPLQDDIVSVGCTGSMKYMFQSGRGTAEDVYQDELTRCPELQRRLAKASRATDYQTTKDFSYRSKQYAGEGWVLIGDAFGFIDPVYSSGVLLAMVSGERAADAMIEGFQKNDLSPNQLSGWTKEYLDGLDNFKRLVYAFYTPDFSFGEFFKQYPKYRANMTDILMGDVFKPGVEEIFEYMGDVIPPSDLEDAPLPQSAMA